MLVLFLSCHQDIESVDLDIRLNALEKSFLTNEDKLKRHFSNTDSAVFYSNRMVKTATQINQPSFLGRAYNALASTFDKLQRYDSALKYFEMAEPLLLETEDINDLAVTYMGLGHIYLFQGSHDLSLAQYQKTIDLLAGTNELNSLSRAYSNIGMVLMERQMHLQARDYYKQAIAIAQSKNLVQLELPPTLNMALSYLKEQQYDSAILHAEYMKVKSKEIGMDFGIGKATYILAESYTALGDLQRADKEARLGEQIFTRLNTARDLSGLKYQRATVSHLLGNNEEALEIIGEMLSKTIVESLEVDVLKLRATIYESLGDSRKALTAYKEFEVASDRLDKQRNEQLIIEQQFKFDTDQKTQQIKNLQTEATISALTLNQERIRLYVALASILIIGICAYLVLTQYKVKSQNEVMELQNKLLRTQLNPHFLFNAMGAIQQYIYSHEDPQLISDYLGKFSRLTRMILNYSKKDLITLTEELDFLRNYIALQQIRFEVPFEFNLELSEGLAPDELLVPPMLTQPFIENAIEHGFLHKEEQGHIDLIITEDKNQLLITVKDDGIGRTQAATLAKKTKHESLATEVTKERLKLIQKKLRQKSELLIKDLFDHQDRVVGTQVELNIPLIKE